MNTKILQLLGRLLSDHGCADIERLCQDLGFSKRMLLYYQKQLNDHLKDEGLPLTFIEDGNMRLDCREKRQFQRLFGVKAAGGYVLEAGERQDIMILKIGLGAQAALLDGLAGQLGISRSTVLSDVREVKEYLSSRGIHLHSSPRNGYSLQGDELRIRYLLMNAYDGAGSQTLSDMKLDILLREVSARSKKPAGRELTERLKELIYASEAYAGKQFNYSSTTDLARNLLLVYLRGFHAHAVLEDDCMENRVERRSAEFLAGQMGSLGLPIPEAEIPYVQALLMGAKIYTMDAAGGDVAADSFAKELLEAFENLSQIRTDADPALLQMLLLHIRSMFYRAKYRIKVSNTIGDVIRQADHSFYSITRIAVESSSGKYGLYVDDDEILYLSLYFSCIGRLDPSGGRRLRPHILVVCGAGLSSSVYVKSQLEKILGHGYQYMVSDVRNLEDSVTDRTVLVVSTVDLHRPSIRPGVPVLTVSTVISPSQKGELINWMLEQAASDKASENLSRIVEIVGRSAEITNRERLVYDLRRYLDGGGGEESRGEVRLNQIFFPEYVTVCPGAQTWREAMYIAGRPLAEGGCVESAYLDDVVSVIEELGPYAECLPGVLLAHANPSGHVRRLSLSAALFLEPIFMEARGASRAKAISIIFVLAVVDHESHAGALAELMTSLSRTSAAKLLAACKAPEEFYRLICGE